MFNPRPKEEKKKKSPKRYVYKRKPTGELDLFKEIWQERPHFCEECNQYIWEFSHYNFHHIKTKASYPELRLIKNNIQLLCVNCHNSKHK